MIFQLTTHVGWASFLAHTIILTAILLSRWGHVETVVLSAWRGKGSHTLRRTDLVEYVLREVLLLILSVFYLLFQSLTRDLLLLDVMCWLAIFHIFHVGIVGLWRQNYLLAILVRRTHHSARSLRYLGQLLCIAKVTLTQVSRTLSCTWLARPKFKSIQIKS